MHHSTIEWTDQTWNPTQGCSKVSAGCKNCYAIRMAARLDAMGVAQYRDLTHRTKGKLNWTGRVNVNEKAISAPYRWRKPARVFVNSMSDLFHDRIDPDTLASIWRVMIDCPQHQFQILTKRPARMHELLQDSERFPLSDNIWLGVSVENYHHIGRLDILREIPAAIRFVSFEPLLSSVRSASLDNIHWAIVGGESGPRSRPVKEQWILEIKEACERAATAFFFKQWGGVNKKKTGRVLEGEVFNAYPLGVS